MSIELTSLEFAAGSFSSEVLHQQQVDLGRAGKLGGAAKSPELLIIPSRHHLGTAVHGYDSLTIRQVLLTRCKHRPLLRQQLRPLE